MSYQRFHKFGAKNRDGIQRIIDGIDFPEEDIRKYITSIIESLTEQS